MADVRSPIPMHGLSWELMCVLLRTRVMCSEIAGNTERQKMVLSDHEEADTRLCLDVADDVQKESHNNIVMFSTVDSDVVVIRVDTFCELKQMQPGVSPYATTMVPYVINLEKKRANLPCVYRREINHAGKHSRSSQSDLNILWRILSYRLPQKFPFST